MVALKHEAIVARLASEIHAGKLRYGERLPGETALADRFGVSRNTVRSALAELAATGLINTHSGKGSFVMFDNRPMDVHGRAHALITDGVEPRSRVLSIAAVTDATLAAEVHLDAPDFIAVERVRTLPDGTIVSFERSLVPAVDELAQLAERGLKNGSLSETLAAAGLRAHHGGQRLTGAPLTAAQARTVDRRRGEWFLHSRRTTFDRRGRFVEDARSLLDPRHVELGLQFLQPA